MARMGLLLFGFVQLALVYGLPAGKNIKDHVGLKDRDVPYLTSLAPTISYSTAIESLQSATITVLPSITGVYHRPRHFHCSPTDQSIRVFSQGFHLEVVSPKTPSMALVPLLNPSISYARLKRQWSRDLPVRADRHLQISSSHWHLEYPHPPSSSAEVTM
jgi:hypothetical protein